eukprot:2820651-Alexandrium_andersonii.AAC.1
MSQLPCANGERCVTLGCLRWHPPLKPAELPVLVVAPHPVGLPAGDAQALPASQAPPSPRPGRSDGVE